MHAHRDGETHVQIAKGNELIVAISNKNYANPGGMLDSWIRTVKRAGVTNAMVVALDDDTKTHAESQGMTAVKMEVAVPPHPHLPKSIVVPPKMMDVPLQGFAYERDGLGEVVIRCVFNRFADPFSSRTVPPQNVRENPSERIGVCIIHICSCRALERRAAQVKTSTAFIVQMHSTGS